MTATTLNGTFGNISKGVSQQNPVRRPLGYHEVQENFDSSVYNGISKRLGTDYVNLLDDNWLSVNPSHHTIYDSNNVPAYMLINNSNLFVWDLQGNPYTVTIDSEVNTSYLNTSNMTTTSLDNKVYLLNKDQITGMDSSTLSPIATNSGHYVTLQSVLTGGSYRLYIDYKVNGVSRNVWVSPPSSQVTDPTSTVEALVSQASASTSSHSSVGGSHVPANDFTFTAVGSTLVIQPITSLNITEVSISLVDPINASSFSDDFTSYKEIKDLPTGGIIGDIVRLNEATTLDSNKYFKYVGNQAEGIITINGTWEECQKGNEEYLFDATTMPHIVDLDTTSRTAHLRLGNWLGRLSGDVESNPVPTFIGQPIKDIITYQSRLLMVSPYGLTFSKSKETNNFFISSVFGGLVADDTIDLKLQESKGTLSYAVTHRQDLIIFAGIGIYTLKGNTVLTAAPLNAVINYTTSLDISTNSKPIAIGNMILFPTYDGKYSRLYKFTTGQTIDITQTEDVTSHIPNYITGDINLMVSSTNRSKVFIQGDNKREIVIDSYYAEGNARQDSWFKYIFNMDVEYFINRNTDLYLIQTITKPDNTISLIMTVHAENYKAYGDYQSSLHIDNKNLVTSNTNHKINIPFPVNATTIQDVVVIGVDDTPTAIYNGISYEILSRDSTNGTVTLKTAFSDTRKLVFGYKYNSKIQLTNPKIYDNSIERNINTGNLILDKLYIALNEYYYFEVKVDYPDNSVASGATYSLPYTAQAIGTAVTNKLITAIDGTLAADISGVAVQTNNPTLSDLALNGSTLQSNNICIISIESDLHSPLSLSAVDFVGKQTLEGITQ